MKRSVILFTALFLFLGMVCLPITAITDSQKEKIGIYEETLYGDPLYAEGARGGMTLTYDENLFWNLEYDLGRSGMAEADFTYKAFEPTVTTIRTSNFSIDIILSFGVASSGEISPDLNEYPDTPMLPAFDIAENMPANSTDVRTVRLSDYYEYLPLNVSYYSNQMTNTPHSEIQQLFSDFFKIPCHDSLLMEYTVKTNEAGQLYSVDATPINFGGGDDWYDMYTANYMYASCEDGIYFTFYVKTPYEDSSAPGLAKDALYYFSHEDMSIKAVCRMDIEDSDIISMIFWNESELLLLAEAPDGSMTFYNFDTDTHEFLQKIELDEVRPTSEDMYSSPLPIKCENGVMFISDKGSLHFFERRGNRFEEKITHVFNDFYSSRDDFFNSVDSSLTAISYNSEKNILVTLSAVDCFSNHKVYGAAFGQNGLLYLGVYSTDLECHSSYNFDYNKRIRLYRDRVGYVSAE